MGKWVVLGLGLVCLVALGALASSIDLLPAGQVVAVIASAAVAALGLWFFFRKSSRQEG